MAVQEVESREVQTKAGISRGIEASAQGMIMDIVQATQYTKPIQSAVREVTSNAIDSQGEKERAHLIISGKAKVEDYFVTREGELYKDSKWNPDYYNFDHLDMTKNHVELIYKEGQGSGRCDTLIIKDYGVGLGGRRLEGALSIGFIK